MDILKIVLDSLVILVILTAKLWIKDIVTKAIEKGCPGKADFKAHTEADERFQRELVKDINEKRADYKKQHEDHYRHEGISQIHQLTMSSETLNAKFSDVMNQFAAVRERVEALADAKRARPR